MVSFFGVRSAWPDSLVGRSERRLLTDLSRVRFPEQTRLRFPFSVGVEASRRGYLTQLFDPVLLFLACTLGRRYTQYGVLPKVAGEVHTFTLGRSMGPIPKVQAYLR